MTPPEGWETACKRHLSAVYLKNPWWFNGAEAVCSTGHVQFIESWTTSGDECEFCGQPMNGEPVLVSWHRCLVPGPRVEQNEKVCFIRIPRREGSVNHLT